MQSLASPDSIVSCTTATYICMAHPGCNMALNYYNQNCKSMFEGKKCNRRCKNSLDILMKQPQAQKLLNCVCEDFQCTSMKDNTKKLCFANTLIPSSSVKPSKEDTEIDIGNNHNGGSFMQKRTTHFVISILVTYLNSYIGNCISESILLIYQNI